MNGGAYGVEVDLYAFAITAVEILTGDLVYPSELPDDVVCAEIANPALTMLRIRHMLKKYASVGRLTAVFELICDFIMMRKNSASSSICLIETLFALVPVCKKNVNKYIYVDFFNLCLNFWFCLDYALKLILSFNTHNTKDCKTVKLV